MNPYSDDRLALFDTLVNEINVSCDPTRAVAIRHDDAFFLILLLQQDDEFANRHAMASRRLRSLLRSTLPTV